MVFHAFRDDGDDPSMINASVVVVIVVVVMITRVKVRNRTFVIMIIIIIIVIVAIFIMIFIKVELKNQMKKILKYITVESFFLDCFDTSQIDGVFDVFVATAMI